MRSTDPVEKRIVSQAYRAIYAVVRKIPRGRVATYGQVAAAAGLPRAARVVGYAMRAAKGAVPWQRVVGKRSKNIAQVSIKDPIGGAMQRQLLEKEGVKFSRSGGIDLTRYGSWNDV
jgi:methylated-DNA-protein-cysteine methyltransferase-like protein